jgi:acetyl esterase/lipase
VLLPGGGYNHLAAHEGEPIARWLNTLGIAAFVLNYRVKPYGHPYPWLDASRAVRTVRARAGEWGIRPDKIGILGFSAGGHLAATMSTRHDAGNPGAEDPIERASSRPDAAVLCYAVTTFDSRYYHGGSARCLFGDTPDPQMLEDYSAEKQVTLRTPPAFIWATADDEKVPLMNSLLYAGSLQACGVPVELHVFPHGRHGLGLAMDDCVVGQWKALCAAWLKNMGFGPEES